MKWNVQGNSFRKKEDPLLSLKPSVLLKDISEKAKKVFTSPFINNVKMLYMAINASESDQLLAFKRFVNEFGTHFSSVTEMGTKLSIERRYTSEERSKSDKEELKECNTLMGSQLFGFQAELSLHKCDNDHLRKMDSESETLERTVISTYGSYVADSLVNWTKQVILLVQSGVFEPHPIRRQLTPISELFTKKNFDNVLVGGKKINIAVLVPWFDKLVERYCEIYSLDCKNTGCGIDDECLPQQYCRDHINQTNDAKEEKFSCEYPDVEIMLPSGQKYIGQVNMHREPHGAGKIFYFTMENENKLQYNGTYDGGYMNGYGTYYYENGSPEYVGHFKNNLPDGFGTHYYQNGKVMFNGTWNNGTFRKGILYGLDGEVLKEYTR